MSTRLRPRAICLGYGSGSALTDTGKVRVTNEDHFLVAGLSKSMQVYKTSLHAGTIAGE